MTPDEHIAKHGTVDTDWLMKYWRAQVGRLPEGHEPAFTDVCLRFGEHRVERAIYNTSKAELRRTKDRWGFFLALFGEVP